MKLYFVRHGTSKANEEGVLQGHFDSPLTSKGRIQAKECAQYFKKQNIKISQVYTSDLQRAVETTKIICHQLNIDEDQIIFTNNLREIDVGDLEGVFSEEFETRYDNIRQRVFSDIHAPFPNGEAVNDVINRLKKWFETVKNNTHFYTENNGHILVVSHGGPIYNFLKYVAEVITDLNGWIENAKVTELKINPSSVADSPEFSLLQLNSKPVNKIK